jgi:hypothetical protein
LIAPSFTIASSAIAYRRQIDSVRWPVVAIAADRGTHAPLLKTGHRLPAFDWAARRRKRNRQSGSTARPIGTALRQIQLDLHFSFRAQHAFDRAFLDTRIAR